MQPSVLHLLALAGMAGTNAPRAVPLVATNLPPVIIIPGSLHTTLEAQFTLNNTIDSCSKIANTANNTWLQVYPNTTWLSPVYMECWIAIMALSQAQQPLPGVAIRVSNFGMYSYIFIISSRYI